MKNKRRLIFLAILLLICVSASAQRYRKWEFINPSDLQITIVPEKSEIITGTVATFTITIRNRTDKTVKIPYKTGQQWDLAAYHNGLQIHRWSQGLEWADSPHVIPLKRGETRSEQLTWLTVDRLNRPLPQGVYKIHGMVMTQPRHLVSNDCSIRLLPEEIKKMEVIDTRLNRMFDIELPRYSGTQELIWKIDYVYNDNRISVHHIAKTEKSLFITFHPKRTGHVEFHLYGYLDRTDETVALERRSYRIEVK